MIRQSGPKFYDRPEKTAEADISPAEAVLVVSLAYYSLS